MSIFDRFRQKKQDDEASRHTRLLRTGRLTDGLIFDISTDEAGQLEGIFYSYRIDGVDYESSQTLRDDQRHHVEDYTLGAAITIRYDPHHPSNSVVV